MSNLVWLIIIIVIIAAIRAYATKKRKGKLEDAWDYIREIRNSEKQYCLVLRPFGNDGNIHFKRLFSGNILMWLFVNWWQKHTLTVEELVSGLSEDILKIETVALVNPKLTSIPVKPKFIASKDQDWQLVVKNLLVRALVVVIYIPPGGNITESLKWEILHAFNYGLYGRVVFLLPPPDRPESLKCVKQLKASLAYISETISNMPETTILFYPTSDLHEQAQLRYWFFKKKSMRWYKFMPMINSYADGLEYVFKNIRKSTDEMRFSEKYLFKDADLFSLEDDVNPFLLEKYLSGKINPGT